MEFKIGELVEAPVIGSHTKSLERQNQQDRWIDAIIIVPRKWLRRLKICGSTSIWVL